MTTLVKTALSKFNPPRKVRCLREGNSGGRLQKDVIYDATELWDDFNGNARYTIPSTGDMGGFYAIRFETVDAAVASDENAYAGVAAWVPRETPEANSMPPKTSATPQRALSRR